MRTLLSCFVIILITAAAALAFWSGTATDQYISYDDNLLGWYTRMAVTSDGTIHVVWNEKVVSYPTQQEIHYSSSSDNGRNWSAIGADIIISYDDGVNAENGSGIAVDPNDNIYVVWGEEDLSFNEIHYSISTDGGNTWSGQTADQILSMAGGNNAFNPDIAVDSNGDIHVVWNQVYGTGVSEIHYSRSIDGGQTWSSQTAETIVSFPDGSPSSYADIEVGPNDELYVMWKEDDDVVTTHDALNISISTDGGNTWSGTNGDTPITLPFRIILYPQIITDRDNHRLHAVWKGTQDTGSPFHYEVYYTGSNDGGTTWTGLTQEITVSCDDGNGANIPNLGSDSRGNVIVVWDEDHLTGDNEIHISVSPDGGNYWSGARQDAIISFPDGRPAYRPFVVACIDDTLHVTWNEGTINNYYQIHYSRGDAIPDFTVQLTYNYGSPVPAGGGFINFDVFLQNNEATLQNFDLWIEIPPQVTPPGVPNRNLTFPSGFAITRPDMNWPIPAGWPAGNYDMVWFIGDLSTLTAWARDSFPFEKSSDDDGSGYALWEVEGDPLDQLFEGVDTDESAVVSEFALLGAYPNPFNPTTTISYRLDEANLVMLTVYDLTGSEVATIVDGYRDAGAHEVNFDASGLASGVYVYRLTSGEMTASSKMVLMK